MVQEVSTGSSLVTAGTMELDLVMKLVAEPILELEVDKGTIATFEVAATAI